MKQLLVLPLFAVLPAFPDLQVDPKSSDEEFRVTSSRGLPEDLQKANLVPNLPQFQGHLEYSGLKTRLQIDVDFWHEGNLQGRWRHQLPVDLPLSGDLGIGFREGSALLSTPAPAGHKTPGRRTTALKMDIPQVQGLAVTTFEPAWPLHVDPRYGDVLWGVFVNEQKPKAATLQDRATQAHMGWLFRIRMADPDLQEDEPLEAGTTTFPGVGGRQVSSYR